MKFLYPEVFYMMLVPLVLLIVLLLTSKQTLEKYFTKEILEKISVGGKVLDKNTRNGLLFITLILFIIALSRPVINQKEQEFKQNLIPIVVAIDVSTSMMATDIYPNRISLAIQKLKKIIEHSPNSMIGVVLFAKDAFVLSPLTEDFISLKYIVDNMDTRLNFPNGSNIFATLETTAFMLEEYSVKNLIILSDGGNSQNYQGEIDFANTNKIAIYTIGMATTQGAVIPQEKGYLTNENGDIVTVKLNEAIKELSLKTNGGYIDFSLDNSDVEAIVKRINEQSKTEELSQTKLKTYTELFYYPLGLGIFILFIALSSFPSRAFSTYGIIFIVATFLGNPSNIYGDMFPFQTIEKAKKYYEQEQYSKASQEYRNLPQTPQSFYNLGNSLYKEGKYQEAIEIYSQVITQENDFEAKKLHNIGNSYVKLDDLEKAKSFYEKALKIKEDKETRENLEIVKKELEKRKQNQEEKPQQEPQNNQEQKEKEKQEEQNQSQQNEQNNNDEKSQENQDANEQAKQNGASEEKEAKISQMEEQKWMEHLENQQPSIFLQKADTKMESQSDEKQPW